MAVTDSAGVNLVMNTYNEYGVPTATGSVPSRFGYTGQVWLPEISMAYYKARMYAPTLGRFLQTDPIGYADGMNWYAYVGNDPMNGRDPSGTESCINLTYNHSAYTNGVYNADLSSSMPIQICIPDVKDYADRGADEFKNRMNSVSEAAAEVVRKIQKPKKPCQCGAAIAQAALNMNNDKSWAQITGIHGKVGMPTCNIFVGTAIQKSGVQAPKRHVGLWGYRSASDWANPSSDMGENFEIDSSPHLGDIVANHGHVGIITGSNESTGANPDVGSRSTAWPFNGVNVSGKPTYWRCKCD